MSQGENIQEIIERYHTGKIPESELLNQAEKNAELWQEFELYKTDMAVVRAAGKARLKAKAATVLKNKTENQSATSLMKWIFPIVATIILIIVAFILYQKLGQNRTAPELYAIHFELPPPSNERSPVEAPDLWKTAMTDYANQDFRKVIQTLSPALKNDDFLHTESGKLYLALSHLMVDENQEAISILDKVSVESSYFQDAEWYQALAFLKINKPTEARVILQKIAVQPSHYKQEEAAKLFEEIQK